MGKHNRHMVVLIWRFWKFRKLQLFGQIWVIYCGLLLENLFAELIRWITFLFENTFLKFQAIICFIECESGEKFSVRSCVKGKLISINQKVAKNPNLILEKSPGEVHLAIILTKIPDGINDLKSRLITEEEYCSKNAA